MAGRGTASSFPDALQALLSEVGALLASPDADVNFVMQLREMITEHLYGSQGDQGDQSQAPMPPGQVAPLAAPTGEAGPIPVTPTEPGGMSRGPTPTPDLAGMTEELRRAQNVA